MSADQPAPAEHVLEQPPLWPLSWPELVQLAASLPQPPQSALDHLYATVPRYVLRPSTWQRDPELTIATPKRTPP